MSDPFVGVCRNCFVRTVVWEVRDRCFCVACRPRSFQGPGLKPFCVHGHDLNLTRRRNRGGAAFCGVCRRIRDRESWRRRHG